MLMKQIRLLSIMAMVLWASALSAQSHWQCDYAKFSESMAIYFQLADGDNVIADVTPYEVAAFVGEECRGVATFQEEQIDANTVKYGYLRIYSNAESAEKIILKVYNKSSQLEKRIAISSFLFETDKRIGVPSTPVKYDITASVPKYQLTVTPQDAEMGTAEGSGTFEEDEIAHIKATANTGYHFVKWSDEDTDEERAIVITQKTDLVAVFAPNQHLLTFISEGDTVRSALQDYNSTIVPPENPQKEGYSFVKWVPNLAEKMPNNALTYEATYKINEYTMTFVVDGTTVREALLEYGKTVPVPQSPSKTGYTFAGWDPVVPATVPGSNMTFTAQWTAISYTISYDLAGGQLAEGVTNPEAYTIESEAITLKNPTREGYTFAGWTGTGLEQATMEVTIAAGSIDARSYTATWTINQYTITFDSDGGSEVASITADYKSTLTKPADPTKEGYTFAGWSPEFPETMPLNGAALKATWTINQYTITFDSDGGSEVASITADYKSTLTKPTDPTKEGYTFAGWSPEFPETMPLNGAALKATWTINQYTITFDSDGGSEVASITADYKSTLTKPNDPTKEGYTFAGWSPAFPETMPLNGAALKATWTPNQYTITFDSDGGSEVASITADYKSTLTKPADPTKEGYTFAGWSPEFPETMPLNGAALKATWTINQYTITFDSDGGSEVASITADYKSTLTKPNDPTKEGYTFAGWSPAFPETMPLNGAALKATWTPNQYTITFDSDGGSEVASITADYKSTLTKPADPTKEGYTFAGWSPTFPETMPLNGAALKATWTINQYTITFDSNGGTAVAAITQDYGTNVTAPADPTKEGYTFAGWDKAVPETMPAENVTLTAQWTVNEYTMTFVLDNGQENVVKKQNYGTELTAPENVAKTGYSFNGWSPEVPATVPASDKTFTAQWTINQYTITFDCNGGTAVAAITQDYGTNVTAPADPTKEGYTFAGWDKAVPETMPAENVTLKATWTPVTYSISYDLDGGQLAQGDTNPVEYTIESEAITLKNPTKEGFEFTGWTGTDLTQATMTVTIAKGSIGNRTYTATWTPASGIKAIFRDSKTVNVYRVNGTLVGRDMTVDEVIQLKHGIYVVNGKKIAIK